MEMPEPINSSFPNSPNQQLATLCRELSHPFAQFARKHVQQIRNSLWRHSCGVIVSGGQTGVDTAAFDVADSLSIPRTGFAPRSYINETGAIGASFRETMLEVDDRYGVLSAEQITEQLRRAPYARYEMYAERTRLNARFSDATLILTPGPLADGNLLTYQAAVEHVGASRVFVIDLTHSLLEQTQQARQWLRQHPALFLNVAGSRETSYETCGFSPYERGAQVCRDVLM